MAATVEGVFRIIDRASGPMQRMQRQALMTDAAIDRLGRKLDTLGNRNQITRMDNTERGLKNIRTEATKVEDSFTRIDRSSGGVGRAFRSIGRDSESMGRSFRSAERDGGRLHNMLRHIGEAFAGVKGIVAGARMPAMAAGIGFLVQAVGALGGGVTSLLPRIVDLAGVAGALPATFLGIAGAMGTVKLAFADVGKAMNGNKRALQSLTPDARRFVTTLKEYQPVLQSIRRSAQQGLFPGLDYALARAQRAVPLIRRMTGMFGRELGGLAGQATERFTQQGFLKDLGSLGATGNYVLDRLGRGVMNLVDAIRHVAIAARPFTRWLAETVFGWTQWADKAARAGRESGRLAQFFDRTRTSLTSFGHMIRNVYESIHNIGMAARASGDSLWQMAERATAGWVRFTGSLGGQLTMQRFFHDTRDVLVQTVRLVADLIGAIVRMGHQPGVAGGIGALRNMVKPLEEVLNTAVVTFVPALLNLVTQVLKVFSLLTAATGPINVFLRMITGILSVFNTLTSSLPGFKHAFTAVFSVVTIGLFARRLSFVQSGMKLLAGETTAAAAAQERLNIAESGGVAGGARGGARGAAAAAPAFLGGGRSVAAARGESLATAGSLGLSGGAMARGGLAGMYARLGALRGGGAAALLRTGGGAALRFAAPIAAIMGLFGAATAPRQGNFGQQLLQTIMGGLSGATMGLIPRMQTPNEQADAHVRAILQGSSTLQGAIPITAVGMTLGHIGGHRVTTPGIQQRLNALGGDNPQNLQQAIAQVAVLRGAVARLHQLNTASGQDAANQLKNEIRLRDQVISRVQRQRRQATEARGIERANRLLPQFGQEFNYLRARQGTQAAMTGTVGDIISQMGSLPERGRTILAHASLVWAAEAARQNPKLVGQYNRMRDAVLSSFQQIHDRVRIWNNVILTGTRAQWRTISDAMATPLEVARERISQQFTYIQQEAVQALLAMGYTRQAANKTVQLMEGGGHNVAAVNTQGRVESIHASGGRIPGRGLQDSVMVAPSSRAAPGELIVNRHTENRINSMLAGTTTLGREVNRESRPHSMPFYVGGRVGTYYGHPGNIKAAIRGISDLVLSTFPGLGVSATTDGRHANGSYHYMGEAVDISGSPGLMNRAAAWIGARLTPRLLEGIHNPNLSVKFGRAVAPGFWGASTWAGHRNHIHLAAGGAGGALGGAPGALQQIGALGVPAVPLGGVAGAVSLAVGRMLARGMRRQVNRHLAAQGGAGGIVGAPGGGSNSANAALAHRMMLAAGWGEGQWPPLDQLWTRESGFSSTARNRSSGAFGIPQALPASKMGAAGAAGNPAAQIAWGLKYIRGRYGSPSAAWAHELAHNWYGMGGRTPGWGGWHQAGGTFTARRPTLFGVGDGARPETVSIRRRGLDTQTPVTIGRIVVNNHREGDIRRQIEQEVESAFTNLAHTLTGMPMEGDEELMG